MWRVLNLLCRSKELGEKGLCRKAPVLTSEVSQKALHRLLLRPSLGAAQALSTQSHRDNPCGPQSQHPPGKGAGERAHRPLLSVVSPALLRALGRALWLGVPLWGTLQETRMCVCGTQAHKHGLSDSGSYAVPILPTSGSPSSECPSNTFVALYIYSVPLQRTKVQVTHSSLRRCRDRGQELAQEARELKAPLG